MTVECTYCGNDFSDGEVIEIKKGEFCCDKCMDEAETQDNIRKNIKYFQLLEKQKK